MDGIPRLRARASKGTLVYVERIDPDAARRIREHAPPEALRAIEEAPRMSWVPLEYDDAVFGSAWQELFSAEQVLTFLRGNVNEVMVSPILRPLVEFALRGANASPAITLKFMPRGWAQIWRDCAKMSVEITGADTARLHLTEMHDLYAQLFPRYHYTTQATIECVCALTKSKAQVEFEDQLGLRRSVVHIKWQPEKS